MDESRGAAIRNILNQVGGVQGIIGTIQGLRGGPNRNQLAPAVVLPPPRPKTDYTPVIIGAVAVIIAAMIARRK